MLRTTALLLASFAVACGSSVGSNPGPLVDNTLWVPTDDGEAIFGTPPPDADVTWFQLSYV